MQDMSRFRFFSVVRSPHSVSSLCPTNLFLILSPCMSSSDRTTRVWFWSGETEQRRRVSSDLCATGQASHPSPPPSPPNHHHLGSARPRTGLKLTKLFISNSFTICPSRSCRTPSPCPPVASAARQELPRSSLHLTSFGP